MSTPTLAEAPLTAESVNLPADASIHFYGLTSEEIALLPLLAWAAPHYERVQARVLSILGLLAQAHPTCLDITNLPASVRAAFARPMLALTRRSLVLELAVARHQQRLAGDTPQARFASFVADLNTPSRRAQLAQAYPTLAAQVRMRARQVARNVIRLLRRIVADYPALVDRFANKSALGPLTAFKTLMGDQHARGQRVAQLSFDETTVYYKPRSMAIDVAFAELLDWLAANGVTPDQRAPVALDCGNYGYAGAVLHQSVESVAALKSYYRRFGGLVALTYVLGASDLHHENLIASGEYPIIIDAETLLQPSFVARQTNKQRRALFADTVMYSGLLPHGERGKRPDDMSALFMPHESLFARVPTGVGTDELRLQVQQVAMPFAANMARLGNVMAQPYEYVDDICEGFDQTYRGLLAVQSALLAEGGPLTQFRHITTLRVIIRPTQVYAYLLAALAHPDYLSSAEKSAALLRRICPDQQGWRVYRKAWPSERAALLRGDVPYFAVATDDCAMTDDRGRPLGRLYARSAWRELSRHIHALSEADRLRQCRLLREAVACTRPAELSTPWLSFRSANPAPHPTTFAPTRFVAEAIRLGDRILASGIGQGLNRTYYQLELCSEGVLRPCPLGPHLYDGMAGLALFFGALHGQTRKPRFLRATEQALAAARYDFANAAHAGESIGGFSGMSGWLYALAYLGASLGRKDWIDEAFSWLPWLSARIAKDEMLDVIAGTAGALLVLTELDRLLPGRGARELAAQCAEHLTHRAIRDAGGASWVCASYPDGAISGFSHGTAGIANALARYGAHVGDAAAVALARDALRFEQTSYDEAIPGWRDLRSSQCHHHESHELAYAWCHGAPGIGIGRLALPAVLQDAACCNDIERSIALTRHHGLHGSHCLCHGQLGNLALLQDYALRFPSVAATEAWHNEANRILAEGQTLWRTGSQAGHDLLGLMTGLSGIGYSLLRIANPAGVPSLLTLTLPACVAE